MITTLFFVAAALFLISVTIATRITRRSLVALTPEEKARLVDAAAATPMWSFVVMIAFVAVWIYVLFVVRDYSRIATPALLGVFMLASAATTVTTYRRYRRYGLPAPFLHDFAVARGLRLVGAMALFGVVAAWLLGV